MFPPLDWTSWDWGHQATPRYNEPQSVNPQTVPRQGCLGTFTPGALREVPRLELDPGRIEQPGGKYRNCKKKPKTANSGQKIRYFHPKFELGSPFELGFAIFFCSSSIEPFRFKIGMRKACRNTRKSNSCCSSGQTILKCVTLQGVI